MPPKESQAYKNVHAFQPNRGKKVKEREKSSLDTAVAASLAGVCERCSEQLKWCAMQLGRALARLVFVWRCAHARAE